MNVISLVYSLQMVENQSGANENPMRIDMKIDHGIAKFLLIPIPTQILLKKTCI